MLQLGLSLPRSPGGADGGFPSDEGDNTGTREEIFGSSPVTVVITSEADTWDMDISSCLGCGQFVDWDRMPDPEQETHIPRDILSKSPKELKKLAREGYWAVSRALRAQVYHQLIQQVSCRLVTPDALVYRDVASRLFGKMSVSTYPLPEFLEGCSMPTYCLNPEGVTALKKILICVGNLFPDITYSPILPSLVALLLHYSEDEAQCFENISRLIASNSPHTSYIDQSFLAHQASCMTFGDLANKHCPAAHKLIASTSENVFEVYSEWLSWLFHDLPFNYAIRVFDVYLLEGQKVLYRIALALLKQYRLSVTSTELEGTDIKADLQAFVQNIAEHVTVDKLLERAFGIRLFSRKEIWLLQMANRKALMERGITMVQSRQSFHLAIDMQNFSSSTVTAQEMRIIWSWIPERFSLSPPLLLFSTSEDGCSLQRFYTCCEGYEPTVLLIKTTEGEVCGAFLSSDWSERKKTGATSGFFGTGECFVFTVEGEARLCPLMPTCCGGARNTARPLTTLRSARRTSRCSSWKCGAFKMSRSWGREPLTTALMGMGTPCHAGCHWPACCGLCQQCRRHLHVASSPSQSAEVVWSEGNVVSGTGLGVLPLRTSEVPSCSLDPACSTQSIPVQDAGGELSQFSVSHTVLACS
ncbi:TBC1 domain family member 24-like isoform X2 [Lathamus discolor]|uniref:TBC1 domain family member 24-like isoform X2 n=1 Tax=Lathamus discolor TaxID=678569 RepID=UPI0032B77D08